MCFEIKLFAFFYDMLFDISLHKYVASVLDKYHVDLR